MGNNVKRSVRMRMRKSPDLAMRLSGDLQKRVQVGIGDIVVSTVAFKRGYTCEETGTHE